MKNEEKINLLALIKKLKTLMKIFSKSKMPISDFRVIKLVNRPSVIISIKASNRIKPIFSKQF